MSNHTPGPWVVGVPFHGQGVTASIIVARVDGKLTHLAEGIENPANARLISAAPELLVALEWAIGQIRLKQSYFPGHPEYTGYDKAKAAIRKARGEA